MSNGKHPLLLKNQKIFNATALNLSILSFTLALFIGCVNYNPFEDDNNAQALLITSLTDGDTVGIFETKKIDVIITVYERVDSFVLETDYNRFFTDTTIIINGKRGGYKFSCSFYDTGFHDIKLTTFRSNGDHVLQSMKIYAKSPLYQPPVYGTFGDSVRLITNPVIDRPVTYHWEFIGGNTIISESPELISLITRGGYYSTGNLWVSDKTGKHSSKFKFINNLNDTTGPEILYVNGEFTGRDTIRVSGNDFDLKLRIVDQGTERVSSVSINGNSADEVIGDDYIKRIQSIDMLQAPLNVKVVAYDPFDNYSQKTFVIRYDKEAPVQNVPKINVIVPGSKELVTSKKKWGSIECEIVNLPLVVQKYTFNLFMNNRLFQTVDTVLNSKISSLPFRFSNIELSGKNDTFKIIARNEKDSLASSEFVMVYYPDGKDSKPPVIVWIYIDSVRIKDYKMVTHDSAQVRIVAYDEDSGIKEVRIKGGNLSYLATKYNSNLSEYEWNKTIYAPHKEELEYEILLIDNSDNSLPYTLRVRQNTAPFIPAKLDTTIFIGKAFKYGIGAVDRDGDPVYYLKKGTGSQWPDALKFDSANGKMSWTPGVSNIGTYTIAVTVTDNIGGTTEFNGIITVTDSISRDTLKFQINQDSLPEILIASVDTLNFKLKSIPEINLGSQKFYVQHIDPSGKKTELPVIGTNRIVWAPSLDDIGRNNRIVVTIKDTSKISLPIVLNEIKVVSPDKLMNYALHFTGDTTSSGANVLTRNPVTFSVTVFGYGGVIDEKSSVSYFLNGIRAYSSVNSGKFSFTITPQKPTPENDSVFIEILDSRGVYNRIARGLYFDGAPSKPEFVLPLQAQVISDSSVLLQWKCSDPDSDPLRYNLVITSPVDTIKKTVLSGTTTVISGLRRAGVYNYTIVANGKYLSAESDTGSFVLNPPNRVRFKTTLSEFPSTVQVGKTWVFKPIIKAGTGVPEFKFDVKSSGIAVPQIINNSLTWTPALSDTGNYTIKVIVADAIGNSDTLKPVIKVVKKNSPISFQCFTGASFVNEKFEIDMSGMVVPETLTFRIIDPDSLTTVAYSVSISFRHIMNDLIVGNERMFSITVDPTKVTRSNDTLKLSIIEDGDEYDTTLIIFYGTLINMQQIPVPVDFDIEPSGSEALRYGWNCDVFNRNRFTCYVFRDANSDKRIKRFSAG